MELTIKQSICPTIRNLNLESSNKTIQAISNSRMFKHLAVAAGVALLVATLATPPGWILGGAGLLGLISGLFSLVITGSLESKFISKSNQTTSFEITAIFRAIQKFFGKKLYNEIGDTKILLGSFPTENSVSELINQNNVAAFLSLNSEWECKPRGFFQPSNYALTQTKQTFTNGEKTATYQRIDAEDHKLMTIEQINNAADAIKEALTSNPDGKVYVHCRGGVGRSAQAVAGYLIKYKKMTANEAANQIKMFRKQSTIYKKMGALAQFEAFCKL
jgi:hypothetical protein